jgi:hypothetical protein
MANMHDTHDPLRRAWRPIWPTLESDDEVPIVRGSKTENWDAARPAMRWSVIDGHPQFPLGPSFRSRSRPGPHAVGNGRDCGRRVRTGAPTNVVGGAGRSTRAGRLRMTLMTQRTQESRLRSQWSVVRCEDRRSEPHNITVRARNACTRDDFRGSHDAHDAADATIRA